MRKQFHDAPVSEVCLRKFEKPSGSQRELVRKFCISIGLLQPGDSRDIIIDLLLLFIKAAKIKRPLRVEEVYKKALDFGLGASQSNVRRNLRKLKDLDLIEKTSNGYRLREWLSIKELMRDIIKYKVNPVIERIMDYAEAIDNS